MMDGANECNNMRVHRTLAWSARSRWRCACFNGWSGCYEARTLMAAAACRPYSQSPILLNVVHQCMCLRVLGPVIRVLADVLVCEVTAQHRHRGATHTQIHFNLNHTLVRRVVHGALVQHVRGTVYSGAIFGTQRLGALGHSGSRFCMRNVKGMAAGQ